MRMVSKIYGMSSHVIGNKRQASSYLQEQHEEWDIKRKKRMDIEM